MIRKTRQMLKLVLSIALLLLLWVPGKSVFAASAGTPFTDVPSYYLDQVNWAIGEGIIKGYEDGSFRPYKTIDRAHAAVMLANALKLTVPTNVTASPFKDVPASDTYAGYIKAVSDAKIFNGDPNGNFYPDQILRREQMATVLVNAFHLKDNGANVNVADMGKVGASHKANVQILANLGITKLQDGKFNPSGENSRINLVNFLNQVNKYLNPVTDTTPPSLKGITYKFNPVLDILYLTFDEPVVVNGDWELDNPNSNGTVLGFKDMKSGTDLNGDGVVQGNEEESTLKYYIILDENTDYTLTAKSGTVTDMSGNTMTTDQTTTFSTGTR